MPVNRADMVKSHLLEKRAAGDITAGMFDGPGDGAVHRLAEIGCHLLAELADSHIGAPGRKARQIGAHGSGGRCNRHVIVVEDHDQAGIQRTGIVERFICHARRHGTIADHGNHIALDA